MSDVKHRIEFKVHTWLNIWPTVFTWDSLTTLDSEHSIFNSAG